MKYILTTLALSIALSGCTDNKPKPKPDEVPVEVEAKWINNVEEAHKKRQFLEHDAIQMDLELYFGGNLRLDGKMTLATNSSAGRIDMKSGDAVLFLDDKVYVNPGYPNPESVRFTAYTWSYFFMFPYKLSDPGTQWTEPYLDELNGEEYNRAKLTFSAGTGDAPDDWYEMYSDPETNLVSTAAYIVTVNKTIEEAEEDPHAISYSNYSDVDGVPIAHDWGFWAWRPDSGLTDQLGRATLSNLKFVDGEDHFFELPDDFVEP